METKPHNPRSFTARCKVCNTRIPFDRSKPMPKIWYCPICGSKNYSKPRSQLSKSS